MLAAGTKLVQMTLPTPIGCSRHDIVEDQDNHYCVDEHAREYHAFDKPLF